jgi:hypothetical protein
MNHDMHIDHSAHVGEGSLLEYIKFAGVLVLITVASIVLAKVRPQEFMTAYMAVFFLVFGLFKLLDLPGFVSSYIGYDIIAKHSTRYAYIYPFLELGLAFGFIFAWPYINIITLIVTSIGAIGVGKELLRGSKIKCACLGTYIKLPLTTVSLVEDLGMGAMALWLLIR